MKKFIIKNGKNIEVQRDNLKMVVNAMATGDEDMQVSDGYHTMDELYDHRITLFIELCRALTGTMYHEIDSSEPKLRHIWRSKLHSDGSSFDGWFILGIHKTKGDQITYHLPISKWDDTEFAETLEKAPEWDGHSADDVLKRLQRL